jgi:hypothetical protein
VCNVLHVHVGGDHGLNYSKHERDEIQSGDCQEEKEIGPQPTHSPGFLPDSHCHYYLYILQID